jgi:hypothetical protein
MLFILRPGFVLSVEVVIVSFSRYSRYPERNILLCQITGFGKLPSADKS